MSILAKLIILQSLKQTAQGETGYVEWLGKPVCARVGLCDRGSNQLSRSDLQQGQACNHGYSVPLLYAPTWA